MLDFLARLLSSDEFMPHGHCYLWQPGIVALHVISDATIGLAYTSIPFALLYIVRRRRDLPFHWMFLCFGVFIIAGGATHYLEIITLWTPMYWVSGAVKAITAVASLCTALLLVRLLPRAIAFPSPDDMRRAADALRVSEARFRAAIEAGLDAFYVMEAVRDAAGSIRDFTVVEMNSTGSRLIAQPDQAPPRVSQRGRFVRHPELVTKHRVVTETRCVIDEETLLHLPKLGPTWFHHQAVPVGDGVAVTLRDISRRKHDEHARLIASMVASSNDAIMAQSVDGLIESWNVGAERLYGYTAEEAIGRSRAMIVPPDLLDPVDALVERLTRGERVEDVEAVRRRKDGVLIDVSIRLSPIRNDAGVLTGISAIGRDITAAKEADRRLKASLLEKEILLKEVHHRVKNNLQVISSLLNLEAGRLTNPEAVTALRASQSRVRSIAAFHEGVYQAHDLANVDMARYLADLLRGLRATYGSSGDGVTTKLTAAGVVLSADLAIPCGLIVNELTTNAFKHAFPGGRGSVDVSLQREGDRYTLRVADDGVGLPERFELTSLTSLGLQLVQTLSEQVGGTVGIERGSAAGVAFSVSFKASS